MLRLANAVDAELESYIDAFESAHVADQRPAIDDFLPPASHPQYASIVGELLRIDMELSWRRGTALPLDDYRRRFASVLSQPRWLEGLALEEYRMRCESGQAATPAEYRDRYGIDTSDWPSPRRAARKGQLGGGPPSPPEAATIARLEAGGDVNLSVFPQVGDSFLDFSLDEELGRGSFGRVYLARQQSLADRCVALKVSLGKSVEPERLARLQHANIVPIHSVHEQGALQAVCMPFLGRFTLADALGRLRRQAGAPQSGWALLSTVVAATDATITGPEAGRSSTQEGGTSGVGRMEIVPSIRERFERSSYVDAVIWVGAQLAAGLAHAHERGILHRDLKPANILLADDGRPMILDFNLSDRLRAPAERAAAIGGTLPYMAPEHLEALETGVGVDERSDVYSLGVVLYELLTRRLPFEPLAGAAAVSAATLVAERRRGAPRARHYNPWTPRSVDGILARCLAPRPDDRYQSAEQLRSDLERHLANQPLVYAPDHSPAERVRKWARRHPRASSATSLGIVAAVIVAALGAAWATRERRVAAIESLAAYREFVDAAPRADVPLSLPGADAEMLDEGMRAAQSQLARYGVLDDSDWRSQSIYRRLPAGERRKLDERLARTMYLLADAHLRRASRHVESPDRDDDLDAAAALNRRARELAGGSGSAWRDALERQAARLAAHDSAGEIPVDLTTPSTTLDAATQAIELLGGGRYGEALPHLIAWRDQAPTDLSAWLLLGNAYAGIGNAAEAETCYTFCTVQEPRFAFSYFLRGLARLEQRKYQGAADDFTIVLDMGGCPAAAHVNRALSFLGLDDFDAALADLNTSLETGVAPTRVYFIRAHVRRSLGDLQGAADDFRRGLNESPRDAESWLARGMARLPRDAEGARADFEQALAADPGSLEARRNLVHVLGDRLDREQDALEELNAILQRRPADVRALASRAVARARLADFSGAVADAETVLGLSSDPTTVMQMACAFALCSGARPEFAAKALQLLARALGADPRLATRAATDPDLKALRADDDFAEIVAAAETLNRDGGALRSPAPPMSAEDAP